MHKYIVNRDGLLVASADGGNISLKDLKSRDERIVESETKQKVGKTLHKNGEFIPAPKTLIELKREEQEKKSDTENKWFHQKLLDVIELLAKKGFLLLTDENKQFIIEHRKRA